MCISLLVMVAIWWRYFRYSNDPQKIARTVSDWVQDPQKLTHMAAAARAAAAPTATQEIAIDLLAMLDGGEVDEKGTTVAEEVTQEVLKG